MAAITICSDFGAEKNKVSHCFHCFPIYLPWSDRPDAMIFVFWMLSFKPTFSLSSFTFINRLFSSSSLFALRVVSSAYLRLLIFFPAILIPACASSSPAFLMMYSASPRTKLMEVMEFQLSYFKSWKMMLWKCSTQYASNFGKLNSGYRTGKGQFSFQSQRKAMPKNAPTTAQFVYYHSSKISIVFCLCFVNKFPLYHFLDSTYRWYHVILIFVWLTSLSLIISRSILDAANGIISFFLWWSNSPLYIRTTFSLSIHWSIDI